MACESVQYFQFDESGNMCVFEPGAGFTGPSEKVDPGFEIGETGQENLFQTKVNVRDGSDVITLNTPSSSERSQEIIDPTPKKGDLDLIK